MNDDNLQALYADMLLVRRFDELCMRLKMKDLIYSGYHPYEGQEAVAVGFCGTLGKEDILLSTHRPHGHAVAKGVPMESVLAEMMGRQAGCSGGLGGGMQYIDVAHNFFCGSIVGSNMPIATGFGLAIKQKKLDRACVCMFGDGASNTGAFHEALNLAAIWKLPILFVCENNQYAEAMPAKEFVACERISMRARGYGLEEITVDGNDVEATRRVAADLVGRIGKGGGPFLVEALTYRIRGHYVGDPETTYRTTEEVDAWREKEPLKRAREKLLRNGTSAAALDAVDQSIKDKLETLLDWALKQGFPTLEQSIDHVCIPLAEGGVACR